MKDYPAFLRASIRAQRTYLAAERRKMLKAEKLVVKYRARMAALGLHPLSWNEITERLAQLNGMLRDVEKTHGDCEAQRSIYRMYHPAKVGEKQ